MHAAADLLQATCARWCKPETTPCPWLLLAPTSPSPQVMGQLPDKVEKVVHVPLSGWQKTMYEKIKKDGKAGPLLLTLSLAYIGEDSE